MLICTMTVYTAANIVPFFAAVGLSFSFGVSSSARGKLRSQKSIWGRTRELDSRSHNYLIVQKGILQLEPQHNHNKTEFLKP